MKIRVEFKGELVLESAQDDFESAYEFAEEHAETVDWSDEYSYIVTDEDGDRWELIADSWEKMD